MDNISWTHKRRNEEALKGVGDTNKETEKTYYDTGQVKIVYYSTRLRV